MWRIEAQGQDRQWRSAGAAPNGDRAKRRIYIEGEFQSLRTKANVRIVFWAKRSDRKDKSARAGAQLRKLNKQRKCGDLR